MSDYSEIQKLAQHHINLHGDTWHGEESPALASVPTFAAEMFIAAANPAVVLELIEHNELLTARLCECKSCGGEGELHSGDWHHYGHMEPPEPVMEKCGECDGSGRLGDIQDLDHSLVEIQRLKAENESANSRLHEVAVACATAEQERDQLKAENAGLKTGYEAYEQIVQGLKAENEALRKDADRLEKAAAFVQQLCDAAGKQPSVATGYLHDILSAMSKEPSHG